MSPREIFFRPPPIKTCSLSQLHETAGTHPRARIRAFFSPRWNRISTGVGLEQEHFAGNKRSLVRYHAQSREKYFPRLFFLFLFSGCAHPFARIGRKLHDQKQTPTPLLDRGDTRLETDRARKMASEKLEGGQDRGGGSVA